MNSPKTHIKQQNPKHTEPQKGHVKVSLIDEDLEHRPRMQRTQPVLRRNEHSPSSAAIPSTILSDKQRFGGQVGGRSFLADAETQTADRTGFGLCVVGHWDLPLFDGSAVVGQQLLHL